MADELDASKKTKTLMECVCLRYFNVYGPKPRFDPYGNVGRVLE
jgi:nucleoside-diphosphate-sugar epimerase